jgi:PEGA domain
MRRAAVGAAVLILLAVATTVRGQGRGTLTSRPAMPTVAPRPGTGPPVRLLPLWWHWAIVTLPETTTPTPPRLAAGAPTGGVQLDVLPWSAQVYVDGELAGRVEEFRGYYQHLEIPAGPHVIAIVKPGYEPLVVDVVVVPGRTITYRGTLR